eukprot:CAMPEP_0177649236 /NCGR_PEP_ID=MMETSP0447-20121125/11267_1 /TAXON_ID=0 /ORGANISM="Stygamoeba regulata, Strain BSH-02190019" /LENGTH=458 /DNA_ID=CAMNT_0019151957 /DNA_START=419 /DNA_END=1796 /DNA_ORIENTATION=+
MTPVNQGLVTCMLLIGAAVGAVSGGYVADRLGRRPTVFLCGAFTFVFALASARRSALPVAGGAAACGRRTGRRTGQLGVSAVHRRDDAHPPRGVDWGTLPAGHHHRHPHQLSGTAAVQDLWFDWQTMFAVGAVPGFWAIILSMTMPPSQMEAAEDGITEEEYRILTGNDPASETTSLLKEPVSDMEDEEPLKLHQPIKTSNNSTAGAYAFLALFGPGMLKRMLTALMLTIALQLTGINSFLYYATDIFEQAGFSSNSLLPTVGIGAFQVVITLAAIFIVKFFFPKYMLLTGLGCMTIASGLLGVLKFTLPPSDQAIPSVLFLCLFIVGFSIGPGSLFWVLLPQTFEDENRQAGASLFNAAQWTWNVLLSAAFPPLSNAVGQGAVFLGFSVVGVCSVVSLFFLLPGKAEVAAKLAAKARSGGSGGDQIIVHVQASPTRSRSSLIFQEVLDDADDNEFFD